jgi:hypothetical protein
MDETKDKRSTPMSKPKAGEELKENCWWRDVDRYGLLEGHRSAWNTGWETCASALAAPQPSDREATDKVRATLEAHQPLIKESYPSARLQCSCGWDKWNERGWVKHLLAAIGKGASELRYRPELLPDPDCKACKQGWPIHAEADGSNRQHIDVLATKEFGVVQPCPTQNWPDEDEEWVKP